MNPLASAATIPTQLPAGVAPAAPATQGDPTAALEAAAAAAAAPAGEAAAAPAAPELNWPCPRCQALVPMSEDYCPACGTGFLADAAGMGGAVKLPLIGEVGRMNSGQKLVLGSAIAFGIILGIVVFLTIGAKVL